MPGPPAPFILVPLPNIGRSGLSPKGYSKSVKIEGHVVAIAGASFGSKGDIASKPYGGGILSANVEGPTRFIAPGSHNVKIEGKSVHLLGDATTNNNGPSGSPPNAATLAGILQAPLLAPLSIAQALLRIAREIEEEVGARANLASSDGRALTAVKCAYCYKELHRAYALVNGAKSPLGVYASAVFSSATGRMVARKNPVPGGVPQRVPHTRQSLIREIVGRTAKPGRPAGPAAVRSLQGKQFPGVVIAEQSHAAPGRGNIEAVYEFKFPQRPDKKPAWGPRGNQAQIYQQLFRPAKAPRLVTPWSAA